MSKGVNDVLKEREKDYGNAKQNFTNIGRSWGALLNVSDISPEIVALMFDVAKSIRISVNPTHEDSWIDKEGYIYHGKMIVFDREP